MKAKVNLDYSFEVESVEWDLIEIKNGLFHIIYNDQSFVADVVSTDYQKKSFVININNSNYEVVLKDQFDELLEKLGMDNLNSGVDNEVKSPMPGRIINVSVEVGSKVGKGDSLLVLEAMKMENIIKSTREGVIKSIEVGKDQTVEKNQLMFVFE